MDVYATAREMAAALEAKRVSARELLDMEVARNEKLAKTLNAVVATDLARAQRDAKAVDDARAKGAALGPLAGIPMTIKDGLDVENMPALCGNPGFAKRPKACPDAAVVKRARAAGAVIWGKTNVPLMLGDIQTYNSVYGTTNNPYDVSRTPGGSSGGAAAALATGITPLEIGSDIGGSLRHPANFCGLCSLKPTWGVLDQRGHIPPLPDGYFESDLNVVGPMARNVEDLKLLWSVLRKTAIAARRDIKGARIAVWTEEPGFPLATDVKARVDAAAQALARAGAQVERAKPDISGEALMESYSLILSAVIAVSYPDELFRGLESTRESDLKALAKGGKEATDAGFRLASTASFREVMKAGIKRQAMKDRLAEFFAQGFDGILMPITTIPAFKHMQEKSFNEREIEVDGKVVPYMSMLQWIAPATALHAPALAVQAGRTPQGLPVGVQVVGAWHGEDRLFDVAAAIEDALGGFTAPPLG
jgi:amidase